MKRPNRPSLQSREELQKLPVEGLVEIILRQQEICDLASNELDVMDQLDLLLCLLGNCRRRMWVSLVITILLLAGCHIRRTEPSPPTAGGPTNPGGATELQTTAKDLKYLIFLADLKQIEQLAAQGVNFNVPMQNGDYPLFEAIRLNKPTVISVLVRHGARLDQKNRQGQTALVYAITENHQAVVAALLELGADPNQRNQEGDTSLYLACKQAFISPAIVGLLIDYKADYRLANAAGQTPIQALTWGRPLDLGQLRGREGDKLAHLIRAGYRPTLPTDAAGQPSLHELVKLVNHAALITQLIQGAGLEVNARDANGWTPLHVAMWKQHTEAAKALLSLGADPNAETTQPALKKCIRVGGNPRTGLGSRQICRYGAPAGSRPLDIRPDSLRRGWSEIVRVIQQAGGRENPNVNRDQEFIEP
jgi:hypothetical protein